MMNVKNPIPPTPEDWLMEIAIAYNDAKKVIPAGQHYDVKITEKELFHLASITCFEFRGIPKRKKHLKQATDAALSSYTATFDINKETLSNPILAFTYCYLCSHFGLDLLGEKQVNDIMEYIVKEKEILDHMIKSLDIH